MRTSLVACVVVSLLSGAALAQGGKPDKAADKGAAKAAQAQPGQAGAPPAEHGKAGQEHGKPGAAAAGAPDMSKVGPASRKPTNEAKVRKEVQAFFQEEDALMKKGDFEAMLARVDFPVFMMTDDSKGVPMGKLYTREQYSAEMKPFFDNMPKDMKVKHKPTVTVLSDSLVNVADDFTMTMAGKTTKGKNAAVLVKRDGQWRWKAMVEAGWGDVSSEGGATGQ